MDSQQTPTPVIEPGIVLIPQGARSGQLSYVDKTQTHVVRREIGYAQDYVYRQNGVFIDKDASKEALYERNNLKD